jgi:isopentenyl-diphosphate delta-isomerase type 1
MTCESFDVVDEFDNVICTRTRKDVHQHGLKHRAVHILVFNTSRELFLQKRSMSKDCFPGTWDSSAAGHLDPGESYDQCAVRELREELSLSLPCPPSPLFKINACDETGQEFVWVYRCEAEGPFQLHPDEIERGDWFTSAHVSEWLKARPADFAPGFALIWRKLTSRPAQEIHHNPSRSQSGIVASATSEVPSTTRNAVDGSPP